MKIIFFLIKGIKIKYLKKRQQQKKLEGIKVKIRLIFCKILKKKDLKKEVTNSQIIYFFKKMVILLFTPKVKNLKVQKTNPKDFMLQVCLINNLYKIKVNL